ncbi:TSUP family transporter [Candidatus Bathyarchaeota archaeon]|nr:TSUP family transporter [Candidatus Bathyarchaeota archaeon]
MIEGLDPLILFISLILGFAGGFIDNALGMGYGLLTPFFIFLGFDPLLVVPTLLLSQMIAGFSGTIFHVFYKNVDFKGARTRETRIYVLFTTSGVIGTVIAAIFAIKIEQWFILLYIGLMMIAVGIITRFKIKFNGSWHKLYIISAIAGFNKAISGGGYGPLVTSAQIMVGSDVKNSVGVTQFSESTISAIGYVIYLIYQDLTQVLFTIQMSIIMVISGAIAAPLGALLVKNLKEELARKIVGTSSLILGIISIARLFVL